LKSGEYAGSSHTSDHEINITMKKKMGEWRTELQQALVAHQRDIAGRIKYLEYNEEAQVNLPFSPNKIIMSTKHGGRWEPKHDHGWMSVTGWFVEIYEG
jgi:hypothetical protein